MMYPESASNDYPASPLERMTDEDLLEALKLFHDRARLYLDQAGRLEQEIFRRMDEREATAIPSERFVCQVKVKNGYHQPAFTPLKEIFNDADLKTCFTPEHPETQTVPDKWDTQKVISLSRKYGKAALAVVEQARIPQGRSLEFKKRI